MSKLVSGYSLAVAASSTFAVITLPMALVAETAAQLHARGVKVVWRTHRKNRDVCATREVGVKRVWSRDLSVEIWLGTN